MRATLGLPRGPQADEAPQLDDRLDVILDAEVADAVDAFASVQARSDAFDDDRRRLLSAPVATCRLARLQRCDQSVYERAHRLLVGPRHLVDHGRAGEDVALHGKTGAGAMSGPVEALRTGKGGGAAVGGDDPELARLPAVVAGQDARQGLLG